MSWRSRRRVEEARPKSIGMRLCLLIVNLGGWASGAQDGCRPGVQVVENAVAVTGGLIPCGSTSGRAEWPAITSFLGAFCRTPPEGGDGDRKSTRLNSSH